MTTKTFKIAGFSKNANGQYKARFANNSIKARTAILESIGLTEVTLAELPQPMTKVEAVNHLLATLENIPAGAGVALKHVLNSAEDAPDAEETFVKKVIEIADKAKAKSSKAKVVQA